MATDSRRCIGAPSRRDPNARHGCLRCPLSSALHALAMPCALRFRAGTMKLAHQMQFLRLIAGAAALPAGTPSGDIEEGQCDAVGFGPVVKKKKSNVLLWSN